MKSVCVLATLLSLALAGAPRAAELTPGLYDRPVLALDPGMHTAPIIRADVDRDGRFAVTGSYDKTVRIWSLADGGLERTIRLPTGPDDVGKAYAVAISPDGTTIAAGGWTRWTEADPQQQIYLFDRESGAMTGRFDGLPSVVNDLAFSDDGDRLAAVLGLGGGLRLYGRDAAGRWSGLAADGDYGDQGCFGVAFAADGRLATTSYEGRLRLYDAEGRLLLPPVATPHARPFGLAFNPTDGRLAVGFDDSTEVLLYDGATLAALPSPDVSGIDNGSLLAVAWSEDGATLFAAGRYYDGTPYRVFAWDNGGGPRRRLPASDDTVMSLRPLPREALFAAAQGPWLRVITAAGAPRWTQEPKQIDPRGQQSNFAVSADGMLVEFGLKPWGEDRLRFDLAALKLLPPAEDGRVAPPVQDGLDVAGWENTTAPTRDGAPLPLAPYEIARSLASIPTAAASCSAPTGPCAPSTRPAPSSGGARSPTASGRLTSPATGGSRSLRTATARSAGTAWRTGSSCWRCFPMPTARTGSPGSPTGAMPRRCGRATTCAGW